MYDTNTGASTSSGSVIMVISVSLYKYQAEQLLSMLTHSSSNKRVGDNVTVSGSPVYLMHLPKDVLTSVAAQDIHNSAFGSSPQYLSWGMLYDFFVAVVTLPYTLVVCAFNFAVSLAQAAVNLGLQIIGTLCASLSRHRPFL